MSGPAVPFEIERVMSYLVLLSQLTALSVAQANSLPDQPSLGFRFSVTRLNTVEVTWVDPKGLAERMGLKAGDTITEINRNPIRSKADLSQFLKLPGDYEIKVTRRNAPSATLKGAVKKSGPGEFFCIPSGR